MPSVEVFRDKDAMIGVESSFDFLPRVGEYLAVEEEGYFKSFKVVEIWHRLEVSSNNYQACIRVELDD